MARKIMVTGTMNEPIMTAEEFPSEKYSTWRYTDVETGFSMLSASREMVISRIAELIHEQKMRRVTSYGVNPSKDYQPDGAGNMWIDGEYCHPTRWLPLAIPEIGKDDTDE